MTPSQLTWLNIYTYIIRKKIKKGKERRMQCWIMRFSWFISASMATIVPSPSLQSFPPAEAIRSSSAVDSLLYLRLPTTEKKSLNSISQTPELTTELSFRRAPILFNSPYCPSLTTLQEQQLRPPLNNVVVVCDPSLVHVAITLDVQYLRGSIAAVHSILQNAKCPESVFFHFLVSAETKLETLVRLTFPELKFKVYYLDPERVRSLISTSVRQALEQPLNYARNYLADLLEPCVERVIYLDSDLVLIDDVAKLWETSLGDRTIGAPEYCHANFTKYFTDRFWEDQNLSTVFDGRRPCYFNTGVMVMDLNKWRRLGYTRQIERWMEVQKKTEGSSSTPPLPSLSLLKKSIKRSDCCSR